MASWIAGSLPALQQMCIGADLEKSRQLYLPSIGSALLLGVLGQDLRARPALYAAILGFQAAALWHNIDLWKYAAAKSRPACAAAAACARQSGRALIIGMPRSLNGVYFFANGFPTCVESELGAPAQIEMRTTDPQQEGNACTLSWDSATDTLKRR